MEKRVIRNNFMSNLFKSKILLGVMIVAVLFVGVFALTMNTAKAADCTLTETLKVGSSLSTQVMCLQSKLGMTLQDGKFGPNTLKMVKAFQIANGLNGDGVVGNLTRTALNGTVVENPTPTPTPDQGNCPAGMVASVPAATNNWAACVTAAPLQGNCPVGMVAVTPVAPSWAACVTAAPIVATGGAGSVDSYSLVSNLSNKTVGEGQVDVKVAGLEIKPSTSSDLSVTAVKLVFTPGTATAKLAKYAGDVSVWLGDTELARTPATDFTSSNSYTKTLSLASGAVIKAGVKGTLYVKISGASTIDSGYLGQTWTVSFDQVRWVDGQNAMITDNPFSTANPRTFKFDSASVGSQTTLKVLAGDSSVNNPRVTSIGTVNDTLGVTLMSFKLKVDGTSPVYLDSLPINFTVTGATNVDQVISGGFNLAMDGANVGNSDLSTDCIERWAATNPHVCTTTGATQTYKFSDMGLVLQPGTHNFVVTADILPVSGNLPEGTTISAVLGETQTNLPSFDATLGTDGNGDALANADETGSAVSGAFTLRSNGTFVTLTGTMADNGVSNTAGDILSKTVTSTVTVEAGSDTVYIGRPIIEATTIPAAVAITSATLANPGVFLSAPHSFVAGDGVVFSGTVPTGVSVNTLYYVISAGLDATHFEVSTTPGGAGVAITATGTGTVQRLVGFAFSLKNAGTGVVQNAGTISSASMTSNASLNGNVYTVNSGEIKTFIITYYYSGTATQAIKPYSVVLNQVLPFKDGTAATGQALTPASSYETAQGYTLSKTGN